jgi:hypothetical protein
VLRRTRTALLIDGIEKMTSMSRLQALPQAFCHEERIWYRGLTALEQSVVPVVKPDGFLTPEELFILDASLSRKADAQEKLDAEAEENRTANDGIEDLQDNIQDTGFTQ